MIKVLVVEDDRQIQSSWKRALSDISDAIELIQAFSISEAEKQYTAHFDDIVIVIMDGCVPGDSLNTVPLVQKLRQTFFGPMIAVSGMSQYRTKLIKAGCDYECEKNQLPEKILKIIQELGI